MKKALLAKFTILIFTVLLFSCREKTFTNKKENQIKIYEAKGITIPLDSSNKPKVFVVNEKNLENVKFNLPIISEAHTNIKTSETPIKIKVSNPVIKEPGTYSTQFPKVVLCRDSIIIPGIPKTVIVKDPASREHNSQNFSTFGKLQGLKHGTIRSLLEDSFGNIWIGTDGGVSKYDGKTFTHYTENEGLSNNYVITMIQDKKGSIWFGTNGGVTIFDGEKFKILNEKNGLSNNFVNSLAEDNKGNIWIGTRLGLNKFDGKKNTIYTDQNGLNNNLIFKIIIDRVGNIWLATDNGLTMYDYKKFYTYTKKQGLFANDVTSIIQDKVGNIWLGNSMGFLTKYDGKYFYHYALQNRMKSNVIMSLLEDSNKNIWIATDFDGVIQFDGINFTQFSENEGLADNMVRSQLEDRNGNLWFGTYKGVSKYEGKNFIHYTEREGLKDNIFLGITKDTQSNLWFAFKKGITKYNGKTFAHYIPNKSNSIGIFRSIINDKMDNLWLGTDTKGLLKFNSSECKRFTTKDGLASNTINAIIEDRLGEFWLATDSGVVNFNGKKFTTYTEKQGLVNNYIRSLFQDKYGNLWFGASIGGVSKFDGKKFINYNKANGFIGETVLTINDDKDGNVWFGTYDGVCKYDGKNFIHYNEKNGLVNNAVLCIIRDKANDLILGTRFGISIIDSMFLNSKAGIKEPLIFKNYTYQDGFTGIGIMGGKTILEAEDGVIWIGANDRITIFYKNGYHKDTIAPNIQLLSINISNETIPWSSLKQLDNSKSKDTTFFLENGNRIHDFYFDSLSRWYGLPQNLQLAYNNNFITFNFIGISTNHPGNIKYQYKLDGFDESWSTITSKNEISYSNLPNGKYIFQVKAINGEGYCSKEFTYSFSISPPFWKTWWFRFTVISIVVGLIIYYVKKREYNLLKRQFVLEKTVEDRTAEVLQEKKIVEQQKDLIEAKHKEINDSINYAERIQRSFLASKDLIDENLKDYFILFEPKAIVSGDFYWAFKNQNTPFLLLTADSTGHGVPGAFMSIANISCLNEAVNKGFTQPSNLLNETRRLIVKYLKNDGSQDGGKDGMDASIISFDFENNKIKYAGANNPIWIVRENRIIELQTDKMPVGKHDKDNVQFSEKEFDIQANDMIYTLTDGLPDQFGGPKGKKFMYKQLKELLISISPLQLDEQKKRIAETYNTWKGDLEQVDDITLIGIRI